mmetsp:Transcript_15844/g.43210  ORF Transcript_15844/g.43210 Transcript_15844/m.43210 type:complete len:213 (+) Transcript_15844:956-1594(+)
MVLGVWVRHIPLRLLGRQHFIVLDGHGLDVTLAEVEGQPATFGILATCLRGVPGWRKLRGFHDGDLEKHAGRSAHFWHGQDLKSELASWRKLGLQRLADLCWSRKEKRGSAAFPEHLLNQHTSEVNSGVHALVVLGETGQRTTSTTVLPGKRPLERPLTPFHLLEIVAIPQDRGCEVGVERRGDLGPCEKNLHRRGLHGCVSRGESHGGPCA